MEEEEDTAPLEAPSPFSSQAKALMGTRLVNREEVMVEAVLREAKALLPGRRARNAGGEREREEGEKEKGGEGADTERARRERLR